MRCEWCGEETSNDAAFCPQCGHRVETGEEASEALGETAQLDVEPASASVAADDQADELADGLAGEPGEESDAEDDGVFAQDLPAPDPDEDELVDAPSAVGDAFGFELAFDDDGPVEFVQDDFFSHDSVIPPILPPEDDELLVDAPSGPDELVLGKSYVAIIAVMATMFAAAVILLTCVVLIRVLGL